MMRFSFKLIICLSCLLGSLFCKDVHQSPADVMCLPEENVTLTCNHSINNYDTILWYQRTHGDTGLKLIGYASYSNTKKIEDDYDGKFTLTGNGESSVSLQIAKASQELHSAFYFCAAYYFNSFADLKFGPGTRLTVLEPNMTITPPTVTLMPPSPKELCKAQGRKGKVTLVCLATHFYPDHVSIIWQVNEKERNNGVATDHVAQQNINTSFYSMSSRLHVNHTEWTNVKNKFTCIISFYNGSENEKIQTNIAYSPGKIPVRVYLMVQFGYMIFISKSLLYAVFVSILVWMCKPSKEKTVMTENGDIVN